MLSLIDNLAVIVLAAGKGTRMQSDLPKVLHTLNDKPIVFYVLEKFDALGIKNVFVVLSHQADLVKKQIQEKFNFKFVYQDQPIGTANAVAVALKQIPEDIESVLIVNGDDSAFYSSKTLKSLIETHDKSDSKATLTTFKSSEELRVGRIIRSDGGGFKSILEPEEYQNSGLESYEFNCGMYVFDRNWLEGNIDKIPQSAKGEYYLTEVLNMGVKKGEKINIFQLEDKGEWFGINTQEDLKKAEKLAVSAKR